MAQGAPAPSPSPTDAGADPSVTAPDAKPSQEQGDKKIRFSELPEPVKKSLASAEYKGWLVNTATHNSSNDTYTVELKNGTEKKKVTFNKEGKKD